MRLVELFDNPLPYTLEMEHGTLYGSFKTQNGEEYDAMATSYPAEVVISPEEIEEDFAGEHAEWLERFAEEEAGKVAVDIEFSMRQGPVRTTQGLTGTGDSVAVFSTVVRFVKQAIETYDPDWLTFSAKEASRQKLYERLIRTIARGKFYKEVRDTEEYATFFVKIK